MSKKKIKIIFVTVGDYPASFYTTPDDVKELLYDLQYQLLSDDETGWRQTEWSEETLRSLAAGLVQAKLGWSKPAVTLRVSEKDAEKVRSAKKRAREHKKYGGETPESMAPGYMDGVLDGIQAAHDNNTRRISPDDLAPFEPKSQE